MRIRIKLVLSVFLLSGSAFCQTLECVPQQPEPQQPITIEARVLDYDPPVIRAEGDVLFRWDKKRLYADEAVYNFETGGGVLTEAVFTTCDKERMDYHIAASRIELTPDQRLKARRVRIYLGSLRILSLPGLKVNVGPRPDEQSLIPRPGYNSSDGLFLSTRYSLVDTPETLIEARARFTTRRSIQGGLTAGRAIKSSAQTAPPYIPDFDTELRRGSVLQPFVREDTYRFTETGPLPSQVSGFGALLARDSAYDVDQPDLLVSRLPELGVRYVGPRVCILQVDEQPEFGVQSEVRMSWGNFTEHPGGVSACRWDARGTISSTLATIGRLTALRGSALARYSTYENNDSYTVLGGSLDVSRIFPPDSFISIRLITHWTSGSTPFEFDDIDIPHELQSVGRYVRGRNILGVVLRYDLEENRLRDWELSIGRTLHCLQPSIVWHNKLKQLSFNIRVLGL